MFKNIGAQWIRTVIFIVVGLVVPPLMNLFLGQDTYGAWEMVMSTTGIMKMLALGVPIATVRAIAAAKDDQETNQIIGTSKKIFVFIGLAAIIVGGGFFWFFELIYLTPRLVETTVNGISTHVMESRIASEDIWAARIAFGLIVGHVALSFVLQLPYTIMAGKRDFVQQNKIMVFILLIRVLLIVCVLTTVASIVYLAAVEIATLILEFILPRRAIRKKYPMLRFRIADFDRKRMKTIFGFGGYMVLMHAGVKLAFQTDALVIGWGLDPAAVVHYARSNTFIIYLIELMIAVAGVVMPMAAKLQKEENLAELEDIFLKWSKITLSLALMVGIYLLVLGPEFISWWMHRVEFYEPAQQVVPALMISCFFFLPMRAVALPMLLGLGKVKFPAWLFLGVGITNIAISIALIGPFGLFGVALGTAIPNIIYAVVILIYACRAIESSILAYMAYVLPRCIIGAIPVIAGLVWLKAEFAPRSLPELMLSGIAMVVVFVVIWVGFVYRHDRYMDLLARLKSLLSRTEA